MITSLLVRRARVPVTVAAVWIAAGLVTAQEPKLGLKPGLWELSNRMDTGWNTALAICLSADRMTLQDAIDRMPSSGCTQEVTRVSGRSVQVDVVCGEDLKADAVAMAKQEKKTWRAFTSHVQIDRQSDTEVKGTINSSGGFLHDATKVPVAGHWLAEKCDAPRTLPVHHPEMLMVAGIPFDFWSTAYPDGFGVGAVRDGAGCTDPVLVYRAEPSYTSDAMRAHRQGDVMVEAVVAKDGTIKDVRVVQQIDDSLGLNDEALKAAKRWRFKPAMCGGSAADMIVTIKLQFRLHSN